MEFPQKIRHLLHFSDKNTNFTAGSELFNQLQEDLIVKRIYNIERVMLIQICDQRKSKYSIIYQRYENVFNDMR